MNQELLNELSNHPDGDTESPNVCGGPKNCEGRKFDNTKTDCQECLRETYGH